MHQSALCDAIATEDTSDTRWTGAVEAVVRVVNVVFWVVAPLLVAALFLLNAPVVIAVLMVAVVCSGAIALYEFRLNPMADTERGEWTGRQLFYGLVFTITFFVAFLYVLTVVF
jgi:small-conductance mechanosensitive channel